MGRSVDTALLFQKAMGRQGENGERSLRQQRQAAAS